ncbi:peptidoglycan endopeptidase [Erwinia pyrifoliae]|nr:peptidoglycan endopeptidase [Erwinia pyrifoliae]MCA8877114.1 NlpC/P60 family protein [Erwinia pyrifoliae]
MHELLMEMMRLFITLFMLAFAQLFFNMAHASPQAPVNADRHKADRNIAREDERRKKRPVKASTTKKIKQPPVKKTKQPARPAQLSTAKKQKLKNKTTVVKRPTKKSNTVKSQSAYKPGIKKTIKKRYGRQRADRKTALSAPIKLSNAHRIRYQKARESAVNKLMGQLGKPYLWGGSSPKTGFDCSGLVWYAYKDLVKFKIPRTANEMYHLRDAAPIRRDRLEKGDLVFFRLNSKSRADHVGVYLGGGKFIQSPRTGKDIQVSTLGDDFWQEHYIGARRVVTPKTVR